MKTIIGSETEFGLATHDRRGRADEKILDVLLAMLNRRLAPSDPKDLTDRVSSWDKNPIRKTFDVAGDQDSLRRLGMTGNYLKNGARFYVDGAHLEYSTPECTTPLEVVAHERCGEEIAAKTVSLVKSKLGLRVDLLKRNTDYRGHSYACHEDYLTSRKLFDLLVPPFSSKELMRQKNIIQAIWSLHLTARQIFTGSGSIDITKPWPEALGLSQRQPFVHYFSGYLTTEERAIINTRDHPYADPQRFGRLHVICGDSNRSDWSNVLKYGTSRLVLDMLESCEKPILDELSRFIAVDPVCSFRSIKDKNTLIETENGNIMAIEVERLFYEAVCGWQETAHEPEKEWISKILSMWDLVLKLLETDDERLMSMLDFFIKKRLFEERLSAWGSFNADKAKSLEHNYHTLGPESMFEDFLRSGRVEQIVKSEDVAMAHDLPPKSRAETRAYFLARSPDILWKSWHEISFCEDGHGVLILMPDPTSLSFERKNAPRGGKSCLLV